VPASLRIELFVADLDRCIDFYPRVLRDFRVIDPDGYLIRLTSRPDANRP
jgi:hypothetical protein